jgi:hypothetical protein
MGRLAAVKQVVLSVGLYRQVWALRRAFSPSRRRSYKESRLLYGWDQVLKNLETITGARKHS